MRQSSFQWKKGFSVKRGEAIQWMGGLAKISIGKAIQWRGPGDSVNRWALKIEKLLSASPSRKSALTFAWTEGSFLLFFQGIASKNCGGGKFGHPKTPKGPKIEKFSNLAWNVQSRLKFPDLWAWAFQSWPSEFSTKIGFWRATRLKFSVSILLENFNPGGRSWIFEILGLLGTTSKWAFTFVSLAPPHLSQL